MHCSCICMETCVFVVPVCYGCLGLGFFVGVGTIVSTSIAVVAGAGADAFRDVPALECCRAAFR